MTEIQRLSPNHTARIMPISAIILHDTVGAVEGAVSWLCNPASKVSAHIVISKAGDIYRLVPDDRIAWHAGHAVVWQDYRVNDFSLGVELERLPFDDATVPWPYMQLQATAGWCATKCIQYRIPLNRIAMHKEIAIPVGRKQDPRDFDLYGFLLEVARRIS